MSNKRLALEELVSNPVSRRTFAKAALGSGVFAGVTGLFRSPFGSAVVEAQSGITDLDILNFALNLEYLEAEFYTVAVTGRRVADLGIGTSGTGTPGATTGGKLVSFSEPRVAVTAQQVAADEQAHVTYLRAALGSAAVAKPAINLDALGLGFTNQNEFITLARAFEDVGVSAYGGAAPLIQSRAILAAAVRVALTEAQHASVLRLLAADARIAVPMVDGQDVPPIGTPGGRLFQVDGQGLSTVRTTSQVLAIVYANNNANANAGGFFPSGVNGNITRV
jgi:hypothetical protein